MEVRLEVCMVRMEVCMVGVSHSPREGGAPQSTALAADKKQTGATQLFEHGTCGGQ